MNISNILKKAGVEAKVVQPKKNSKNNIPKSYIEALNYNIQVGIDWLESVDKLNTTTPPVYEINMANYVDAEGNRVIYLISKGGSKLFESKEDCMFQKGYEISNDKETIMNTLKALKEYYADKSDKDLYNMWITHSYPRLNEEGIQMLHPTALTKAGKPKKLTDKKYIQIKELYS